MKKSQLVLGTTQLGMDYGRTNQGGQPSPSQVRTILELALAAGVTGFDTARAYGDSEKRLGSYFSKISPNNTQKPDFYSKLMPLKNTQKSDKQSIQRAIRQSLEQSLQALQVEQITVLMSHRLGDLLLFDRAGLEFLGQQRDSGFVVRLGVSVMTLEEFGQALSIDAIEHIQLPTSLVDHRWLATARTAPANVTLHARSIFLQGLLLEDSAGRWPARQHYDAYPLLRQLDQWVDEFGRQSRADLCLSFVRSLGLFDGIVIGVNHADELQQHIDSFKQPLLEESQLATILQGIPRLPDAILDPYRWAEND